MDRDRRRGSSRRLAARPASSLLRTIPALGLALLLSTLAFAVSGSVLSGDAERRDGDVGRELVRRAEPGAGPLAGLALLGLAARRYRRA